MRRIFYSTEGEFPNGGNTPPGPGPSGKLTNRFLGALSRYRYWPVVTIVARFAHERSHIDDPLALLAGDLRPDGALGLAAELARLGLGDRDLSRQVLLKDVAGGAAIRPLDLDLHVEAARPQDGRVDEVL